MLSSKRFCQAGTNEVDFLLQLHLWSRSNNKGTNLCNDLLVHLKSNWTFLRKAKLKRQSAVSYTSGKRETWEGNTGYCSRCHKKSSFCFIIWHSHIQCSPCFTVSLLQVEDLILSSSNQWVFWLLCQWELGSS